jgi:hypothetical protein
MSEVQKEKSEVGPKEGQRVLAFVKGSTLSKALDLEVGEDEALAWPHLVYIELLASMLAIIFLWILSLAVDAPLEGVINPSVSPNPAKAPWYFRGLQELLVYFDPWIGGVLIPTLIIVGLMAIPYLDPNKSGMGTGYVNFSSRKFAMRMFAYGLLLWFLLIVIGTYFRGPNWAWYWPWEDWSIHKEFVPTRNLSTPLGLFLMIFYFGGGLITLRVFKRGFNTLQFLVVSFFVLSMFGVLGKIALRLIFNVKYVLVTPWFNI